MDLVEYHLKLVINLWCGASPSQYTVDSELRDIWQEQVPNLDYDTDGVPSFLKHLYQDSLFSTCTAAHNITPGELITGGGLQTFSSVYLQLTPCADAPMLTKATPAFASAALRFDPEQAPPATKPAATKSPAKKSSATKSTAKKLAKGKG